MKKLLAILLMLALVVTMFAGCTKKVEEPATETPATETPAEPKVITPQELVNNVNARKAIAAAIDKEYLTSVILANGSQPADYFVSATVATDESGNDFRAKYPDGWNHYDPAKAQEYWQMAKDELGFESVSIELLTYDSDSSKKISEFIQGQLQDTLTGLTLTLNQQPFENKLALADEGKFQLEFAGWGPDYPDPMTFMDMWVTGGGHNTAGYSNPDYDKAIADSKTGELTKDPAARWTTLQEAENLLIGEEQVLVPLYQRGGSRLTQPYVGEIWDHAFGGDYSFMVTDTQANAEGKKVLRLVDSSDIPSMDVSKATDAVSFLAMNNVMEGLVRLDANDVPIPGVAESWDVSEDGLTYTFHLRDTKWSNGDAVKAQDFVYSWQRLVTADTASQYNFMAESAGIVNASAIIAPDSTVAPTELGVKAIDDKTLEVTLAVPTPYFVKLMAFASFYPQNQAFVEKMGDTYGTSVETVLYNGPFQLSKWEIGYQYEYAKNANYWNASVVKLDAINFRIIKDTAAGVNLYETGEIDRIGLSGEFVEQYIDHPHFTQYKDTAIYYLVFNIGNEGKGQH
jgi:oligopeptide transport system substrate-binding protein